MTGHYTVAHFFYYFYVSNDITKTPISFYIQGQKGVRMRNRNSHLTRTLEITTARREAALSISSIKFGGKSPSCNCQGGAHIEIPPHFKRRAAQRKKRKEKETDGMCVLTWP